MNKYEVVYIIDPAVEEEARKALIARFNELITGNGGSVDVNAMEELLGVPVVPISAAKNQGIDELVKHAVHVARYQERPLRQDFCGPEDNGGAVHRSLHAVCHLIEDHAREAGLPVSDKKDSTGVCFIG
jgi:ferrous iron transport protein B